MPHILVGLGNPGATYEGTRHNVGRAVAIAFAARQGWKFQKEPSLEAEVAQGHLGGRKVYVVLPTTFMNLSGKAVRAACEYWKVPVEALLVISDDVALSPGRLRMRFKGSSGGHNGLESVEASLGTLHYARLRIGVGSALPGQLEEYVLGRPSREDAAQIAESLPGALSAVERWITEGIAAAMQEVNAALPEESK
jgi:PTH1 family peptidyl-tRNA hydrolase